MYGTQHVTISLPCLLVAGQYIESVLLVINYTIILLLS